MKRVFVLVAAVSVFGLLASSAVAAPKIAILIRHQTHGCHAWSTGLGKPYSAAQSLRLTRGSSGHDR
jgi:hypothetical protein